MPVEDKFDILSIYHETTLHRNESKILECQFCSKQYTTEKYLNEHMKNKHLMQDVKETTQPEDKDFKYIHCKLTFTSPKELNDHMIRDHNKKKHSTQVTATKCGTCGKILMTSSLSKHIKEVHDKRILPQFTCDICEKGFANIGNLKQHITAIHFKMKPFQCEICDTAFVHKSDLGLHVIQIHENVRVRCNICAKHFSCKKNLARHFKSFHLKTKEVFHCKICPKQFKIEKRLHNHLRMHQVVPII